MKYYYLTVIFSITFLSQGLTQNINHHDKLLMATEEVSDSSAKIIDSYYLSEIGKINQFKISFSTLGTYAYYGVVTTKDTVTGKSNRLIIPIDHSGFNVNLDNFLHIEDDNWWFVSEMDYFRPIHSLLAKPTREESEKGIVYQYKFTTKDQGKTWEIKRIDNLNTIPDSEKK